MSSRIIRSGTQTDHGDASSRLCVSWVGLIMGQQMFANGMLTMASAIKLPSSDHGGWTVGRARTVVSRDHIQKMGRMHCQEVYHDLGHAAMRTTMEGRPDSLLDDSIVPFRFRHMSVRRCMEDLNSEFRLHRVQHGLELLIRVCLSHGAAVIIAHG